MEAITREEKFLNAVADGQASEIEPITREEFFLAKAAGKEVDVPTPITRKEMFLKNVIDNIGNTGGEVDHSVEDGLIDGTLSGTYTNDRVTGVKWYAFAYYYNVEEISLPNVTSIGDKSFFYTSSLKHINLPKLTNITKNNTFGYSGLVDVELPSLKTLNVAYTFDGCNSLVSASFPALETVGSSCAPLCGSCSGLTTLNVPLLTHLPTIGTLPKLSFLDLPSATSIDNYSLNKSNIKTLIIRSTTLCSLGGTQQNFVSTTVYVPQALIESYQTATNWSTLYAAGTCTFLPIEGSEYE